MDTVRLQVAPTHLRGTLGSVNQLVICFGILGALVCNIVLPATQWRTIFALTAVPPVVLFLGQYTAFNSLSSPHLHELIGSMLDVKRVGAPTLHEVVAAAFYAASSCCTASRQCQNG